MDIFNKLLMGFQVASTWENLLFCFMGTLSGTLIGVLPGIGPTTGVAILIPITFGMNATTAIITMAGVYYGAMFGGATTSILLNVPGESASVMTCVDGHHWPSRADRARRWGWRRCPPSSAGTFAVVMLTFLAPTLASYAVSFGPPEYFALTLMGLTLVTSLGGDSPLKGLISGVLGLLVACIGIDAHQRRVPFHLRQHVHARRGRISSGWRSVFLPCRRSWRTSKDADGADWFRRRNCGFRSLFPNLQDWKDSYKTVIRRLFHRVLHRGAARRRGDDRLVHVLCGGRRS